MTDDRSGSAAREPAPDPTANPLKRLTDSFMTNLPITGVGISIADDVGNQSTITATDATAARLDEIQFDLGDGPYLDALRDGTPVLIPDCDGSGLDKWPAFASSIHDLPVRSLFAFPMVMGAVAIGVVGLYSKKTTALSAQEFTTAISLAGRIASRAFREALRIAAVDESQLASNAPFTRREVHQATGMILVQLNITATDAFLRLRAYAFAAGRSVQDVAKAVVDRTLDFRNLPDT